MRDREQAIETVQRVISEAHFGGRVATAAEEIVDAILALPAVVTDEHERLREAAQAVSDAEDAGRLVPVPDEECCPEMDALRAALGEIR